MGLSIQFSTSWYRIILGLSAIVILIVGANALWRYSMRRETNPREASPAEAIWCSRAAITSSLILASYFVFWYFYPDYWIFSPVRSSGIITSLAVAMAGGFSLSLTIGTFERRWRGRAVTRLQTSSNDLFAEFARLDVLWESFKWMFDPNAGIRPGFGPLDLIEMSRQRGRSMPELGSVVEASRKLRLAQTMDAAIQSVDRIAPRFGVHPLALTADVQVFRRCIESEEAAISIGDAIRLKNKENDNHLRFPDSNSVSSHAERTLHLALSASETRAKLTDAIKNSFDESIPSNSNRILDVGPHCYFFEYLGDIQNLYPSWASLGPIIPGEKGSSMEDDKQINAYVRQVEQLYNDEKDDRITTNRKNRHPNDRKHAGWWAGWIVLTSALGVTSLPTWLIGNPGELAAATATAGATILTVFGIRLLNRLEDVESIRETTLEIADNLHVALLRVDAATKSARAELALDSNFSELSREYNSWLENKRVEHRQELLKAIFNRSGRFNTKSSNLTNKGNRLSAISALSGDFRESSAREDLHSSECSQCSSETFQQYCPTCDTTGTRVDWEYCVVTLPGVFGVLGKVLGGNSNYLREIPNFEHPGDLELLGWGLDAGGLIEDLVPSTGLSGSEGLFADTRYLHALKLVWSTSSGWWNPLPEFQDEILPLGPVALQVLLSLWTAEAISKESWAKSQRIVVEMVRKAPERRVQIKSLRVV